MSESNLAANCLDRCLLFRNSFAIVILIVDTFDVDVGSDARNNLACICRSRYDNLINATQPSKSFSSLIRVEVWSAKSFCDMLILRDADNQLVTKGLCFLQMFDVPKVEKIEAAVRQDDARFERCLRCNDWRAF